jgi:hypothetical protein
MSLVLEAMKKKAAATLLDLNPHSLYLMVFSYPLTKSEEEANCGLGQWDRRGTCYPAGHHPPLRAFDGPLHLKEYFAEYRGLAVDCCELLDDFN